jgi:epoxyqueuosine reductase QueG
VWRRKDSETHYQFLFPFDLAHNGKRIGRNRFVRNVAYAIGNSGDPALLPSARRLAADPDPVVRDAGEWAVARLS